MGVLKCLPELVTLLFKFKTRTYLVKHNFSNNYRSTYITCPLYDAHDDEQEHRFEYHNILLDYSRDVECRAEDINSSNMMYCVMLL